jgi:predicted unusual protein kinase regulating ubiquinone biosynthesis (AarF/ABC1/UbiB family)/nucleotide-binding universal stress UspA family protein
VHLESHSVAAVQRIVVATDRTETSQRAVEWAADLANRFTAELLLVQVVVPAHDELAGSDDPDGIDSHILNATRAELHQLAEQIAGPSGRARVVVDDEPAEAIVAVAAEERADVIVVGNAGMSGNKKFLLSNVPNRITHAAHCTVITVNTSALDGREPPPIITAEPEDDELLLSGRAAKIASVVAKHGIAELFARRKGDTDGSETRETARRLRQAFEELGPTFCKLGQVLSTRPDLVPPEYIDELAALRDQVPPLTESQVVEVMEEELRVPWDDVFESIEPEPLATGSIAQVHRATLSTGERVVVKVQRPGAREEITRDLGLLGVFARKTANRPGLRQIVDPAAVVEHLSESLQAELDFRREAASIERMRGILEPYRHLAVPGVYTDFSTDRLLVMEEIQGGPLSSAPLGEERTEAARQLIESYYKQILTEGFFHADPHPGNMKWWDGRVYFLDFGMVGEIGPDLREGLVLLLLAFWQEDSSFLTETVLSLSGEGPRPDVDIEGLQVEIGALVSRYRHLPLNELQLGPMLQDVTTVAIRYEVPLPATLILTGKALAQIQHATAELDPDVDVFAVAGRYLARSTFDKMRVFARPQEMLYESQKIRTRVSKLVEALERLVGARPGPNLQVEFKGFEGVEVTVRRASRRLSFALAAAGAFVAMAITADSTNVAEWVPIAIGSIAGILTFGLMADVFRRR